MHLRPRGSLLWFGCGLGGGTAFFLWWAGVRGAFALAVATAFGLAFLIERRTPGRIGAVPGGLLALVGFSVSLWLSPPCDFDSGRIRELEDGTLTFDCVPQTGMGPIALATIVGSLVILGLLFLLRRLKARRAEEPRSRRVIEGRDVALVCSAIALATALAAAISVLSQNAWRPNALVRMAARDPIAAYAVRHDPGFVLFRPEAHYDGVYFYAIGADPLALGRPHELLDLGAHRYTHPLYGWLAWILSLGQPAFVPHALLAINLAAMGVAAFVTSKLALQVGASPWLGLLVAINPGLIASVSFDTAEPLGALVLAFALAAWLRDRVLLGGLLMLVLCMTRQPFAVIPIALAAWEMLRYRSRPRSETWKRIAVLAAGPLAMASWHVYLFGRFGEWPFETGDVVLTFPFEGWAAAMRAAAFLGGSQFAQMGMSSLPLLITFFAGALIATYSAFRRPDALGAIYLGLMVIFLSLERLAVVFPKELLRYSSIPLIVGGFVIATRWNLDRGKVTDA